MKLRTLLFSLYLLLGSAKVFAQSPDVVGGQNANNNHPYFVSLISPLDGPAPFSPFCGGSLIRPQWVLTAAHCVLNFQTGEVEDSLDALVNIYTPFNPNPNFERITSDYIAVHPWFNSLGIGDLALMHLKTPSSFPVINLIGNNELQLQSPNQPAQVIGFGIFDTVDIFRQPDTLQIANIFIMANSVANEVARYDGIIDTTMICANHPDSAASGAAAGDSGGPLFVTDGQGNQKQIGIVSFGMGFFTTQQHPGVYTRVSAFTSWIDQTITAYENSLGFSATKPRNLLIRMGEGYFDLDLSLEKMSEFQVRLVAMDGKVVFNEKLKHQQDLYRFNTNDLPKGMYLLQVESDASIFQSAKIIK